MHYNSLRSALNFKLKASRKLLSNSIFFNFQTPNAARMSVMLATIEMQKVFGARIMAMARGQDWLKEKLREKLK